MESRGTHFDSLMINEQWENPLNFNWGERPLGELIFQWNRLICHESWNHFNHLDQ